MSISSDIGVWGGLYPGDMEATETFPQLLWDIKEGPISADRASAYERFHNLLLQNPVYADILPQLVRACRTAQQFQDMLEKLETKDSHRINDVLDVGNVLKERAKEITAQRYRASVLEEGLRAAANGFSEGPGYGLKYGESYGGEPSNPRAAVAASNWSGVPSRSARLMGVRGQLEAAHGAIGYLVDDLATEDGNGGPLLDEHSDALETLRELHRVLGNLLQAIDTGRLDDELGEGFAAEIARFGGRWLAALRDDPARYFVGLSTFATLTMSGLGDWAGFVSGAALCVPKPKRKSSA